MRAMLCSLCLLFASQPLAKTNSNFHDDAVGFIYLSDEKAILTENPSVVSFGVGVHRIKAGDGVGAYLSGIKSIENSNFGVYGRGELISDKYKTGHFWSWNMALGVGYYVSENFIPVLTVGKCFSNYSTCYFNLRHPTANDDDIDAIYYGAGAYFKDPVFDETNGVWEVMLDWSPYKGYGGMSLYLGYGFKF